MAATDGNRLARIKEVINNQDDESSSVIIPSKALQEFSRIAAGVEDEVVSIVISQGRLVFKLSDRILFSRLLEGQYPKYDQLIPQTCEKEAIVNREDLINSLDRVSTMVNERTSIVKFTFSDNTVQLKADTPDAGASEDTVDVEYSGDELAIAFNYRYVLDSLRVMDSEKINIGLGGSLSATLFRPESEEDYLCLIMPVQIR